MCGGWEGQLVVIGECGGRGREGEGRGKRAWLDDVDEFFADGEHQDFLPEGFGLRFRHAEGPGAAFDVAGVLPDGLHAPLEEVHRVLQPQRVEGERVEHLPERFRRHDVLLQEGEAAFVALRLGVLVVVERPRVLEGGGAEVADERQSAGDFGVFVLRDGAQSPVAGGFGDRKGHSRAFRRGGASCEDLLDVDCE